MSTQPKTFITPEQYLEIERKAEFKSEYYNGEMFAMSGAREPHIVLVSNFSGELYIQLKSGPCRQYLNDMRVRVTATGLYTYPDIVILCDEPQLLDEQLDVLLNPSVIIEVLSPSTEAYDRGGKFRHYKSIPSVQQYVLIASEYMQVDVFTRHTNGTWLVRSYGRLDEVIELESLGCQVAMLNLYTSKVRLRYPDGPPQPPSV